MKIRTSILFVIMCLVFSACSDNAAKKGTDIRCTYSSLLKMNENNGYVDVEITNPWDTTKILHKYILVDKTKPEPENLPEGTVVKVPLEKSVVYSSVHMALLKEWNKLSAISGVYDVDFIFIPEIKKMVADGTIKDLGNSMQPEVEKLIETMPDAILLSPYENNNGYGKLEKTGIPIIECADYMEVSPLARAEWMKFYGLLFGCRDIADNEFKEIAKDYNALKDSVAKEKSARPRVFTDIKVGTQWMVAGGNSTMGIFLHDAGAEYVFSDLQQSGSVTMSPEKIIERCHDADIWLIKYNSDYRGFEMTYDKIMSLDPMYKEFKPVKTKQIYCCNTALTGFYESTPFHPERLLRNLVCIFSNKADEKAMIYYKKLE